MTRPGCVDLSQEGRTLSVSDATTDRERGLLGSVQRALRVLDVVSCAEEGVTAKAVARRAGLKLSTTYHLINTLVNEGYLVRLDDKHGFGIGYKIPKLYQQLRIKLDVAPGIASAVALVHERAEAAAYFASFRDTDIVLVHVVDSPSCPRIDMLDVGFAESAHATAFGKVMLSTLSPGARRSYLAVHGMQQLTPMTVTDRWELEAELDIARVRGVVAEVEELQLKFACLAAPVSDPTGRVVGTVAVSAPAAQFEERQLRLERIVRQGAAQASRLIAEAAQLEAVGFDAAVLRQPSK